MEALVWTAMAVGDISGYADGSIGDVADADGATKETKAMAARHTPAPPPLHHTAAAQ